MDTIATYTVIHVTRKTHFSATPVGNVIPLVKYSKSQNVKKVQWSILQQEITGLNCTQPRMTVFNIANCFHAALW